MTPLRPDARPSPPLPEWTEPRRPLDFPWTVASAEAVLGSLHDPEPARWIPPERRTVVAAQRVRSAVEQHAADVRADLEQRGEGS